MRSNTNCTRESIGCREEGIALVDKDIMTPACRDLDFSLHILLSMTVKVFISKPAVFGAE